VTISITQEIIWREVDGEVLILNTSNGYYFSLNGTAAEIWRYLLQSEGKGLEEIAQLLTLRYNVDKQQALGDVDGLIRELRDEGIVILE